MANTFRTVLYIFHSAIVVVCSRLVIRLSPATSVQSIYSRLDFDGVEEYVTFFSSEHSDP